MTNKKLKTAGQTTGTRFSAFLGMPDLPAACDKNAVAGGNIIRELHLSVRKEAGRFGGQIVNFTGDGFLLMFADLESGILALSKIISGWRSSREKFVAGYPEAMAGVAGFLSLAAGLSFGRLARRAVKGTGYVSVSGAQGPRKNAGIAREYLCRGGGRGFAPGFIVMDRDVLNLLSFPRCFAVSKPLPAQGIGERSVYTVWPKESVFIARSAGELNKLMAAIHGSTAAELHTLVANAVRRAALMVAKAARQPADVRLPVLEQAIATYREALGIYDPVSAPAEYAHAHYRLGIALRDYSALLPNEDKIWRLEEAAAAQREAVRIYARKPDHAALAHAQSSLGNTLRWQAKHLAGSEKCGKLSEAAAALKEALRIFKRLADGENFAMCGVNIGAVFSNQAESLSGQAKLRKLCEAESAFRQALQVYDAPPRDQYYAGAHINLGETLTAKAQLLSGRARLDTFREAISSGRKSLKVLARLKSPKFRAVALSDLGEALRDASELFPAEERGAMLDESARRLEQAIKILSTDSASEEYARAQRNLAETLAVQAGALSGLDRARMLNKAAQAYKEALKTYTSAHYPEHHLKAKKKLEELNALTEQADREASVGRMAAQVAHDIRSPLVALDAAVRHAGSMPEEQRVLLRHAVNRIRDIADNLLSRNSARSGYGTEGPGKAALITALVEPMIAEKRAQHGLSCAELEFEPCPAAYGLFAALQPAEFRRILSNLINNAVEAAGNEVKVSVSVAGGPVGHAAITVTDHGKGIPPQILARLGKKGATFGKAGGSGLGLYHAGRTVESWGGRLEIASQQGEGTTVTIFLPPAPPPEWFVPALDLTPGRPLVALDDDATMLRVWRGRLESVRAAEKRIGFYGFSSPEDLRAWVGKEAGLAAAAVYLLDYELLGSQETGLTLARALGLEDRAILVTSRSEEKNILDECRRLNIRLLPKGLAGLVPVNIRTDRPETSSRPLYGLTVLIDDDALVRMNWKAAAREKGAELKAFASAREFYAAENIPGDARVYIDSELGEGPNGEEIARDLNGKGYRNITLETGHPPEEFSGRPPWLKIAGKEPPWR